MPGPAEHDAAVADARAHLAAKQGRPLGQLPERFREATSFLHAIAEGLLKPKRELETGSEIALQFTAGGFGSPSWERGHASGKRGQIRVEGTELVSTEGASERRLPLGVEATGATTLADWFAFGTVVLAALLERHPNLEPAPIRLWPEHFDVATELGAETAGKRANYGASPGDEDHSEPYLYVGPWDQEVAGEGWNATAFVGAELSHGQLLGADDQVATALRFMEARIADLS